VLGEIFADAAVKFPTADDFLGIPTFENGVDDFLDMIEIGFRLERIVDAVVAGEEEFVVAPFWRDRSGSGRGPWLRRGREP